MKYARIKSCSSKKLNHFKKGVWYKAEDPVKKFADLGQGFSIDGLFCNEFCSCHLNGGSWEIVEGCEIKGRVDKSFCSVPCPNGKAGAVCSLFCQECTYHINYDKEKQTVICGHPQNKENKMNNPKWCKHPVECPIKNSYKNACKRSCNAYHEPEIKTVIITENEIAPIACAMKSAGIYGHRWEDIKSIELKVEV